MVSYEVELYVIARTPARRAPFVRTVRLPFVPAAGMSLVLEDGPDEGGGELIQSVCWLHKEQRFVCHTGDDFEQDDAAWEALVRHYRERGYRLAEDGVRVEEAPPPLRAVNDD